MSAGSVVGGGREGQRYYCMRSVCDKALRISVDLNAAVGFALLWCLAQLKHTIPERKAIDEFLEERERVNCGRPDDGQLKVMGKNLNSLVTDRGGSFIGAAT